MWSTCNRPARLPAGPSLDHAPAEAGLTSAAGLLRLATCPPMLVMLGAVLALGGALTMGRYLVELPRQNAAAGHMVAGDFMAFYTGGTMIREGSGATLYELREQYARQALLRGSEQGGWQPYVNPPLLAVLLAPVSALPFIWALLVFNGLMVLAMGATLWMLRSALPVLASHRGWWWAVVLLAVGWHPLLRTMLGGQNTVLTLCLLTGLYVALHGGRPITAGVLLGLLTYKPQFTALVGLLLLMQRQWRVLLWAAVTALAHYGIAALFCGWDWPLRMFAAMQQYQPMERAASYYTHIALLPALDYALAAPWSAVLAWLGIAVVTVALVYATRRSALLRTDFALVWAAVVSATMLVSPHLQFYDAGLLLLPALLGLDHMMHQLRTPGSPTRIMLIIGYMCFPIYAVAGNWGVQPLALWPIAVFVWVMALIRMQWRSPQQAVRHWAL